MRRQVFGVSMIVGLAWCAGSTRAQAPELVEDLAPAEDQARLGEWIEYLSATGKRGRTTSGSTSLVSSSIVMGVGIWAFLQDTPNNELTRGLGLISVAGSGLFMSLAIFELAKKSPPELMLERWDAAVQAELTREELARFEGELRHYSAGRNRVAKATRWANFGVAMTGALVLGLTPAADLSRDGASVGYVTGGVALGVGLLGFAFSFMDRSDLDYWNAYLRGKRPPTSRTWSASPEVGRNFAGARIRARF